MSQEAWQGFVGGNWEHEIDVRDFIQKNYTPYDGDESFLADPTENTTKLWDEVMGLFAKEREAGGVLDMDTDLVSTIISHPAGYIDQPLEKIVGLQTEKPLKRALMVNGGIRMAVGRGRVQAERLRGRPGDREHLHELPQDPQRRRL